MVWSRLFMDVDLILLIFGALGVIKMNFQITRHVRSALLCIRLVKSGYLGYPGCPNNIFFSVLLVRGPFFKWSVCLMSISDGSQWYKVDHFLDVILVLLIFRAFDVIKMNFPITRHVWIAFSCIRYVKSFNLGYPVSSKTLFLDNRLVQGLFLMARKGMKMIIHRCGACTTHFQSIGRDINEFSNNPACLKCTFMNPDCQKWLFRVSGLSQNYIFRYSVSPQFIFHAFGLSKDQF